MSMMKNYFEDQIYSLASCTGYSFDFLLDVWNDEVSNGDADFEFFRAVTLEHDW